MHTSLLPFFAVIRATGDDRASFLHGQLSNHIEALAEGEACYATYNTPKGRVIANMIVANTGGELLLVLAADLAEAVVKRLRMFVLRAKVSFEILENHGAAGRLPDGTVPQPAAEPQLSFPFHLSDGLIEIPLPHGGEEGLRFDLDPGSVAAALLQQPQEFPVAASEVEHPGTFRYEPRDQPQVGTCHRFPSSEARSRKARRMAW